MTVNNIRHCSKRKKLSILTEPHSGINIFIRNVRQIIHRNHNQRDNHNYYLHHRQITVHYGSQKQPPQSRYGKNLLDYNTPGDYIDKCKHQKSDYGNYGVSYNVGKQNPPTTVAAAVGRAHVIFTHLANHTSAKKLNDHRALGQSDGERGKDKITEKARGVGVIGYKPSRSKPLEYDPERKGEDYVRTAYSRGNSRWRVLLTHVIRNAIIPVVTFLAFTLVDIVAGSIIIEQVFAIPGLGRLLLASIGDRDLPVVQVIVMIIAVIVITMNYLADISYKYIDPRVRFR